MKSLIEVILECDKGAKKIISNAELEKLKIERSTEVEIKTLSDTAYKKANQQLALLRKEEKASSVSKIDAIKMDYNEKLRAFDEAFNANSEKWAEDILSAILKREIN